MTVKILQFGTTGQVARELVANAADHDVEITALSRSEADFTDPALAARLVAERGADLVVIAAGYTAVDQAEGEPELARQVNALTPAAIAAACGAAGPALVHFSTDYVFDGRKGSAYGEDDRPSPLNVYGRTKLEGEQLVLANCPRALVLRTSWVVSSHGKNFVRTILKLAREGAPMRVVDDQFGRPTSAGDLARFVLAQAGRLATAPPGDPAFGLCHFANAGETSRRGFARGILDLALGGKAPTVQAITTAEHPAPARRPARGVLGTAKLERVFGYAPRPWREAVAEIVTELAAERRSAA
jgi:dTDP-4-dehydrorhamnose reductase